MINPDKDIGITRPYRVEVDGKTLVVVNQVLGDDIRQFMDRKFGADRVGDIHEITGKQNGDRFG